MIVVVDYGMGNVRTVVNAFEACGEAVELSADKSRIATASGIVLPGVGAFGDGMRQLADRGLVDVLKSAVTTYQKPFLGLCVGMQLLASRGTEHGEHAGLGLIEGSVDLVSLPADRHDLKLPHIGWNTVVFQKSDGLFKGMGTEADFYFVHSYALSPADRSIVAGACEHGATVIAAIERKNIWATQFHPEKSHKNGLALIRNWIGMTRC